MVFLEEKNEEGFGDSNNEPDDMLEHNRSAMVEAMLKGAASVVSSVEDDRTVKFNDQNVILLKKGGSKPVVLKLPGAPNKWSAPAQKEMKGETLFFNSDSNPGGWDECIHTTVPTFLQKGPSRDL
jgi:hypothetical protein